MTTRGTGRGRSRLPALCVLPALLALSGCHLLFPFDTTVAPGEADLGLALDTAGDWDAALAPDSGLDAGAAPSLAGLFTSTGSTKHACTPSDVAVDINGNSYITGTFSGIVDLGSGPKTSSGGGDVFVACYSSTGDPNWSTTFGGTFNDAGVRLAVDATGVYITGYVNGAISFKGSTTQTYGSEDIFVAKLSLKGAPQWFVPAGGTNTDSGTGIVLDKDQILVTGVYTGKLQLDTVPVLPAGGRDGFIGVIRSDGTPMSTKTFGVTSGDVLPSMALDSNQQPVVTGCFTSALVLGGATLSSFGAEDIFVANFGGSTMIPLVHLGGGSKDVSADIALGRKDELHVVGQTEGVIDLGDGSVGQDKVPNGFLVKRSASGKVDWGQITDAAAGGQAGYFSVALDSSGRIFAAGYHDGKVMLGAALHADKGGEAALVVSYSSAGVLRWSRSYGNPGTARAAAVATSNAGDLWVVGSFEQTVFFEGNMRTSADGNKDLFLLKLRSP